MNKPVSPHKPDEAQPYMSKPEMEVIQEGISILGRIYSLFKITKIYALNNELVVKEMEILWTDLVNSAKQYGQTAFHLHQNSFFFNGIKLKFNYSNFGLFRFIMAEMEKREINLIRFLPGLERGELSAFISLLHTETKDKNNAMQEFRKALKENGIVSISAEKFIPTETKTKTHKEKEASRVYFWSITHLNEIFTRHKEEQKIPLLTAKRLIQSIFNKLNDSESFIHGLTTVKNFDEYTLNHSVNVCILALALGNRIGLEKTDLVDLGLSAFFHDIGKLEIPLKILNKPGRLDQDERKMIENHPHFGVHRLITLRTKSYIPVKALNVAMEHHAHENKTGYPIYTKKKTIHLFSKIVKIVDVFDALTTKRPYRPRDFTQQEALNLMVETMSSEFDPVLFKIFRNMIGTFPVGTLVLLDTGEIGIVFETNQEHAIHFRPRVKLISTSAGNKIDGEEVDLTEKDPQTQEFKRSIVKTLDPNKYNIRVSDYFMAQVM